MDDHGELQHALSAIQSLGSGSQLTARIAALENALEDQPRPPESSAFSDEGIAEEVLSAALTIKSLAGQINVIVHAIGILVSLLHPRRR